VGLSGRPRARLITTAWGERCVEELFSLALPAVLAPGNLPALAERFDCEMVILTEEARFEELRQHAILGQIERHCPVALRSIDDLVTTPDAYGMALTYALFRGFEELGPAMLDTNLVFFNSDFILADGSLRTLAARFAEGERLVLAPSYCVVAEEMTPLLQERVDTLSGALAVPSREMAALALPRRHNTIRGKTVNQRIFSMEWIDQLYWLVDENTLLGHQLPIAVVGMRPQRVLTDMVSFWDYGIISEACPTARRCVIADSDDFLMIELRSADTAREQIALGWPTPEQVAVKLAAFVTKDPLELAHHQLVLHAAEIPSDMDAARTTLRAYLESVLRALPGEPRGHVDHPIWTYHYPRFHAARREHLNRRAPQAETPAPPAPPAAAADPPAAPAPPAARSPVRRLARSLYGRVFGFAPHFQISHPYWTDVQPALRALASAAGGRVLVVRSEDLLTSLFRSIPGAHVTVHDLVGAPEPEPAPIAAPLPPRAPDAVPAAQMLALEPEPMIRVLEIAAAEGLSATVAGTCSPPRTVSLMSLRLEWQDPRPAAEATTMPRHDEPLPIDEMLPGPAARAAGEPDPVAPEPDGKPLAKPLPCVVPAGIREFDLCLCELGAEDLLRLRPLLSQVAARMRPGGKIVAFHLNTAGATLQQLRPPILDCAAGLDMVSRIHLAGSAPSLRAGKLFNEGLDGMRSRRAGPAGRGLARLARAALLARRANSGAGEATTERGDNARICTSVTVELDVPAAPTDEVRASAPCTASA
jgi:hypothetical protein